MNRKSRHILITGFQEFFPVDRIDVGGIIVSFNAIDTASRIICSTRITRAWIDYTEKP